MMYNVYIFLHLVGVILFLGGFLASLFLKMRAERTRNSGILAYSFSLINFNDKWFTPLSVLLILIGGFGAAARSGLSIFGTGWIFWSLILFGISGLIFVFKALPLQHQIEKLTGKGASAEEFDWQSYQKLASSWMTWAVIALFIVLGAFVLMVFKPVLAVP